MANAHDALHVPKTIAEPWTQVVTDIEMFAVAFHTKPSPEVVRTFLEPVTNKLKYFHEYLIVPKWRLRSRRQLIKKIKLPLTYRLSK